MTVDLSTIPLVALSAESKLIISTLLNPPKVIPAENGLPRDWRGLAHLCKLNGQLMPLLTSDPNPSDYILRTWEKDQKNVTLKDFQVVLEEIDRWDILDDTTELFERDAERYLEQLQRSQTSAEVIANEIDDKVLTVDDIHRVRQGLENQYYDAFLLYADEDVNFANEMVDKLERQYSLKLCIKDRDLLGGVTFEHEAVMTLISERCNRLIVVISSNFLKSPANKFFLNYAQALGIDKRQRKVIPCLYEKCQLPKQLNYMFLLDYNRAGLYDFWGKLRDSVQVPKVKKEISPVKENHHSDLDKNKESKQDKETKQCTELLELQALEQKDETEKLNKVASHDELNSTQYTKDNNKKYSFLQWTKKKLPSKWRENNEKEYVAITDTVSLPSLQDLDTLSTSTESVEKKNKTTFINKYVKKVQLKKILVKS